MSGESRPSIQWSNSTGSSWRSAWKVQIISTHNHCRAQQWAFWGFSCPRFAVSSSFRCNFHLSWSGLLTFVIFFCWLSWQYLRNDGLQFSCQIVYLESWKLNFKPDIILLYINLRFSAGQHWNMRKSMIVSFTENHSLARRWALVDPVVAPWSKTKYMYF